MRIKRKLKSWRSTNNLTTVIDYFLPEGEYKGFDTLNSRRKLRVLIGYLLFTAVLQLLIVVLNRAITGTFHVSDLFSGLSGVTALLLPYLLKRTGWFYLVAALSIFLIAASMVAAILISGILTGPLMVTLTMLPIMAAFLLGQRSAVFVSFLLITSCAIGYVWYDELIRLKQPEPNNVLLIIAFGYAVVFIMITILTWLFTSTQAMFSTEIHTTVEQLQQTHRRLEEAQVTAESANLAKSEFLATMSHEIRTPLNGVIGMTSLLLDTEQTAKQREFTETIRTSGEALLTIINEILDFSKIEAGQIELENIPFDLRDCLEDALDLVVVKAHEKNIELLCHLPQSVPTSFMGDATRIRQILLNLLSNAVKFTEQGEVLLFVRITDGRQKQNGGGQQSYHGKGVYTVQFCVQDSGIGIPQDRLARLFKSFSQVDASTTRKYGGTGLGLAISKRLCETMGGEMWVESTEGVGSSFFFTLPLTPTVDIPNAATTAPESLLRLKGASVLIVDDNAINRDILADQVAGWGMVPTAVASGEAALSAVQNDGSVFDAIILDVQMPKMNGVMTAQKIKKIVPAKMIPIILLTSLDTTSKTLYDEASFFATISKPVKAQNLQNALLRVFSQSKPTVSHHHRSTHKAPAYATLLANKVPMRILLAEDNIVNQKVIQQMLAKLGYRVDIAANGQEAIDAALSQPYDLVLMDMRMPEVDGREATLTIRQHLPEEEQPLIVAVTAEAIEGVRERLLVMGMDDYLSKPIRPEELTALLERITTQIAQRKAPIPNF